MSDSIFRNKLYEEVSLLIQERIRTEHWKAGDKLPPEAELAAQFDVSRSTVREAVRSLQKAGILRSKGGSGTYVTENAPMILLTQELASIMGDPDHLCDLVQARYLLEPQLAALAAEKATVQEKQHLLSIVEQMQQEHDRFRLMSLGHRFHMALASMSHNAVLCGFYHSAASQMRSMRVLDTLTLEVYLRGTSDHLLIAQAVVNGDGASAAQAMANHLFKDYAEYLRE